MMHSLEPLSSDILSRLPAHTGDPGVSADAARNAVNRKIIVLDDDPTGVQTVNGVYVYTRWDRETIEEAFRAPERMFFILTNSRGLTVAESRAQHREIAESIIRTYR